MIFINPNVNIDHATGIRYGVISANSVDSDFLNEFQPVYSDSFCENCNAKLDDIWCENCQHENRWYEEIEPDYFEIKEYKNSVLDFWAVFNPETNVITVLKSSVISSARLCSPCYPNAGNLDDLDIESGFKTYGLPEDCLGN